MESKVGAFEAKTHLPSLLKRVEKGERFTITNRGKSVAQLIPVEPTDESDVRDVIRQMREFRAKNGPTLGEDLTIRELINEGRRY